MTTSQTWLYSLASAAIGGAATSLSSFLGMNIASASGVDVPTLNFHAMIVIAASGAIVSVAAYLKQSPLPPQPTVKESLTVQPTQTQETKTP